MLEMKGWKADDFYGDIKTQPHRKNAFVIAGEEDGVYLFHCLVSRDSVLAAHTLPCPWWDPLLVSFSPQTSL